MASLLSSFALKKYFFRQQMLTLKLEVIFHLLLV